MLDNINDLNKYIQEYEYILSDLQSTELSIDDRIFALQTNRINQVNFILGKLYRLKSIREQKELENLETVHSVVEGDGIILTSISYFGTADKWEQICLDNNNPDMEFVTSDLIKIKG